MPELKLDPKYDNFDFPTTSATNQSGHSGHLTGEQEAQVNQLRMMLEQAGYTERLDTLTLLRFLRARKFNVELSKQMFINCEKWRKEFGGGIDNLLQTFDFTEEKKKLSHLYPQYYHGTDKDGRPVYIEQLGNIDLTAMYKITTEERLLSNLVVEYEKVSDPRLPACSRKSGHLLETCCTIMDLKGVGLSNMGQVYGYLQKASGISQNYYPERLGKLYVINAPWGFSGAFSVVKKFLDPVTVAKIHVLGSGYKSELLRQVDAENLPKEFGGSCECSGGCQYSDKGPWHDPQFAKPPAWLKKKEGDNTINNEASAPTEVRAGEAEAPAAGGDKLAEGEKQPAAA
ncbi:Sec14 cytosolic factor [Elsinoe australis]|uniref:Sec14 cytosolic factor n=1 Tax=Elsinoe australis TaxID=40998 RepID=A0A2P8A0R6_9PEZI|nr:Sec14 cytosolic factor [Elsinoe australis]